MNEIEKYAALKMPALIEVPMPAQPARLPCVVCGVDLVYDAPEPRTGRSIEAVNIHTMSQPFVCMRCWNACEATLHSTLVPPSTFDASEPTDEQSMDLARHQLDQNEMRARIIIEMARGGYLGNSARRDTGP